MLKGGGLRIKMVDLSYRKLQNETVDAFFDTSSISTNQKLPPHQKKGSLPMPIAETCQVYRGFPPGPRPEEMCKVLIAGSDEQVASARRGFWLQEKKSGDSHFLKPSFQHSKKKQTHFAHFCIIFTWFILPTLKKNRKSKVFFSCQLGKTHFFSEPFWRWPFAGSWWNSWRTRRGRLRSCPSAEPQRWWRGLDGRLGFVLKSYWSYHMYIYTVIHMFMCV